MTKEELKRYRDIKQECDHLEKLIVKLKSEMYSPSTPNLDGMPKSHNGASVVESAVIKVENMKMVYQAKKEELLAYLERIEKAIETLEPRERTLIRLHYIEGLNWEEVCVEMAYSWRQVHRIHSKALEQLRQEEEE